MEWLKKYKIVLASQSPRRRDLLMQAGIEFEVQAAEIDEDHFPEDIELSGVPEYLAQAKANKIFHSKTHQSNLIVIAADCLVFLDNKIYSKPLDRDEAYLMLNQLSGRTHQVISGLCVMSEDKCITDSITTGVEFNNLSDEEIFYYLDHYPPYDKAGAYGIQDWIGLCAVKNITGSYTNIMGLPMERLYRILVEHFMP